ncbi:hypothetical protein [Neorhizobium galegae]|uniref:hypothetical protein n=1 Tax=Neorhizobium galegae TaxID=399 RepID=UPI0021069A1D|nr:hypothetical protein [Neorhizobium galegae]MCQ1855221.1 hypothetical protein [Neorhizobium galegae]
MVTKVASNRQRRTKALIYIAAGISLIVISVILHETSKPWISPGPDFSVDRGSVDY